MKNLFCIIAAGLLCGCSGLFEASNKANEALNNQMSSPWLNAHIVVGKTTPDEVRLWFGAPVFTSANSSSGLAAIFTPDEIWTYSVHFDQVEPGLLEPKSSHWTKVVVFSFKNGTVSNFTLNSSGY